MTDKQDPIAHAARLLREAAEELRQAHAYSNNEGWENETDAKAAYNASTHEAQAKHTLLEASHALDVHSIRVHRKRDGLLMVNARGKSRFMTLRERIAYWLLGNTTDIRP